QPTKDVTLKMAHEPRISGQLVAESGRPLGDPFVLLSRRTEEQEDPWTERDRWRDAVRVPVKADGRFDAPLPFGPPGKLQVRAASSEHQQVDSKPQELVFGKELYSERLVLPDGVEISGRVVTNQYGKPVAWAAVSVSPHLATTDFADVPRRGGSE